MRLSSNATMKKAEKQLLTVQELQKHTPTGWGLLQKRVASQRLWKLMGMAVIAGVFSGLFWYCAFSQLLASSHGSPGARRVALKAIAKQPLRHQAFRALEVMASIYLPLGVAFLWVDWKISQGRMSWAGEDCST
eukprot:s234_g29.t2